MLVVKTFEDPNFWGSNFWGFKVFEQSMGYGSKLLKGKTFKGVKKNWDSTFVRGRWVLGQHFWGPKFLEFNNFGGSNGM